MYPQPTVYNAGMSRVTHLRAGISAGVPVGVIAGELSQRALFVLIPYVNAGGKALVDSGAFAAFNNKVKRKADRRGRPKPTSVDFDYILSVYRRIALSVYRRENLALVAPDEIGDQARSLELLAEYRAALRELLGLGCEVLIPLQRGALTLAECHARAVKILDTDLFTPSMPSNKEAVTESEVLDFARAVRPRRIHFLGLARRSRLLALDARIHRVSPATLLSSDANHISALVGKGRPFTETVDARVAEEGDELSHELAQWGETGFMLPDYTEFVQEVFSTPSFLSRALARRLAELLTPHEHERAEVVTAALSETYLEYTEAEEAQFEEDYGGMFTPPRTELARWLFEHCYGDEAVTRIYELLHENASSKVRAKITHEELTRALARRDRARRPAPLLLLAA